MTSPAMGHDAARTRGLPLGLPLSLELGGRRFATAALVTTILGFAAVSVVLTATSDHVQHPTATALYYGYLVGVTLLAALYWRVRRPPSRFAFLLAAVGASPGLVSWQGAGWPPAFHLAVLAHARSFTPALLLFLAVPRGRPAA